MSLLRPLLLTSTGLTLAAAATAQDRVAITFENLAPAQGTFQTPFWIGLHDGTFDLYDTGAPAGGTGAPLASDALERIAEDGTTTGLAMEFAQAAVGSIDSVVPGPNGPIAPGDRATTSLLVDPADPTGAYLSYASMVLPSNDAFVANGDPLGHRLYDGTGSFVFEDFVISTVLDAGTEVNDEVPMNTAFFGQMAPNVGTPEGGVVGPHPGFLPAGSGGILDDFRFRNGDFARLGYSNVMVRVRRAPAILDDRDYAGFGGGADEVPAVQTPARLRAGALLRDNGETLTVSLLGTGLVNVVGAHLHLGAAGTNGPVVANVLMPREPGGGNLGTMVMTTEITTADLMGPLADHPLDALVAEMEAGNVYVNVHTDDGDPNTSGGVGDNPSGEARAQLLRQ